MSDKIANYQTRIEEEHRSVGGVEVKAVVPYGFDGTNLIPFASGGQALKTQVVASVYYDR